MLPKNGDPNVFFSNEWQIYVFFQWSQLKDNILSAESICLS